MYNMSMNLTAHCPPGGPCAGRMAAACVEPESPSPPGNPGHHLGPSSVVQTTNPILKTIVTNEFQH